MREPARKNDLQEPVQQDGDLAEEESAVDVGRQQHVVEHEEGQRQDRRSLDDGHQVRQRCEAPFVLVEAEDRKHARRIDDEPRQQQEQQVPSLREAGGLEADVECCQHCRHGRQEVVDKDQRHARGEIREHQGCSSGYPDVIHTGLSPAAPPSRPRSRRPRPCPRKAPLDPPLKALA